MPHLILTHPGHESRILPLKDTLTIGRYPDNDIVINDLRISRHHVRFERTEKGWAVFDNGSTSGMTINDSMVGPSKVLDDGDIIRIGGVFLKFEAED